MNKDNKKFVLLFAILLIVLLLIFNKNIFNSKNKNSSDIELKYTEVNNKVKEGVYITDVSEVVENVMPSIVAITSKTLVSSGYFGFSFFGGGERYTDGAGSGIIISKTDNELLILTNNHVVEDAKELSVTFIDDKSIDATVKGTSERKDVAVISVKLKDLPKDTVEKIKIATIGKSENLKVGQGVIAIGNALGYGQSVTTGVISALEREVSIDNTKNKMIQIDAAINGGNSGGALLNSVGEVIGINSAKYSSNSYSSSASIEGMGFAIPISDVKDLIEKLMKGEEDNSGATIGIEGTMTTENYFSKYNMPVGFYISGISKGSGAEKAGLEIGNIITEIDGKKVEDFSDLSNVLYTKKKGDKVTLKISYVSKNEYKSKEVKVTLS